MVCETVLLHIGIAKEMDLTCIYTYILAPDVVSMSTECEPLVKSLSKQVKLCWCDCT